MASNQAISAHRANAGASDARIRVVDVTVSAAGLALLSPLLLLISLAVLMDTGWPILFSQTRVGRTGRNFRMYKFRKFHKNVGSDGLPLTMPNDARLTPVGKFIDATKLNELPQLWNVLSGDMSIVGPRPETLEFADCFAGRYQAILQYKPGILGPSQVAFRHEASLFPADCDQDAYYRDVLFPAKAETDLRYYRTRTLYSDVGWMFRGVIAVLCWRPPASSALPASREPHIIHGHQAEAPAPSYVRGRSERVTRAAGAVGKSHVAD